MLSSLWPSLFASSASAASAVARPPASAAEYYLQWKTRAGVRRSILAGASGDDRRGFLALAYRRELNAPGWFQLALPAELADIADYADFDQVEIYRRDLGAGLSWYKDFDGVFRDEAIVDDAYGQETFIASGPGALGRLAWYHVFWPADVANRTTFAAQSAETILKTLVRYNAVVADATTANGRDRNAPDNGISIQTDAAGGNSIAINTGARKNLLRVLQDLQPVAGGDFDLIKTGANAWQFRFYPGQRGTDRTGTLVFSKERGNMGNVRYELVRSDEATAAVVAGQGEKNDRTIVVRTTGPNYNVSTNNVETFVSATDVEKGGASETAQLNAAGDAALSERAARPVFGFDVLPQQNTVYGLDYDLGDLGTAFHPRIGSVTVQVRAIEIAWEPGNAPIIKTEVAII